MTAERQRKSELERSPERRKTLRSRPVVLRHGCHWACRTYLLRKLPNSAEECSQTPRGRKDRIESPKQLDGWAAMLQAISIGREVPMLEPWIIDEIRRREEERRRGDRPQLELPVPEPYWPTDGDPNGNHDGQGDKAPPRGVVIIGM